MESIRLRRVRFREVGTMAQVELTRVRQDLATMQQAVGVGLPFGREDVRLSLAWAAAGVPLAAWTAWTAVEQWQFGMLLVVPAALVLALSGAVAKKYHHRRARAPIRWREYRHQWLLAAVLTPLWGACLYWGIRQGLSPEAMTVTGIFMAGLGMLALPIVDRTRLFYLGWGGATLLLGAAAPLCGQRYLGLAVGGWLILAGLSTAAIMTWQLRSNVIQQSTD